ncbi:MAG: hypothetical protein ACPKPY_12665, partial [Nitrososphaeraceae archaeon]
MLGDEIGELTGKITSRRILDATDNEKIEISIDRKGKLKGIEVTELITYWAVPRPNGKFYGEGKGVAMSTEKNDTIRFTGSGIGTMESGKFIWKGANFYGISSNGHLSSLDN